MKIAVIVQARMTSTRLPGKVLIDVCGKPMLAHQLARLRRMKEASEIVLATTGLSTDDPVVALAEREGVRWFRGDEHDVLSRYAGATREVNADIVVRVTADCPLVDPEESDRVVRALRDAPSGADYASNVIRRTYPRGLDTEVFHRDVLERVVRLGRSREAREHVTWVINSEHPELFIRVSVEDQESNEDLRWTVDTKEDLALVRKLYGDLDLGQRPLSYRAVLSHVRAHPDLAAMNRDIVQKKT